MFRQEQGSYKQIAGGDLSNGLTEEDHDTCSGTVYKPNLSIDTAYKKIPTEHFEIAEPVLTPWWHDRLETWRDRLETWQRQRLLTGWRFGAISAAAITSCVFLINLIVTIYAVSTTKVDSDGKGVLYNGSCGNIKQTNTRVHLLINVLGTLLLSGSNYCMQCLSAPTRPELDRAHMQKKWLDIGIPSVRNLTRISWKRALLWTILGTSSLPIHLFQGTSPACSVEAYQPPSFKWRNDPVLTDHCSYNSAVFASTSVNEYKVFSVNGNFMLEGGFESLKNNTFDSVDNEVAQNMHKLAKTGKLYSLAPSDCIAVYAKLFQSERGNLLLVSNDDPAMLRDFSAIPTNATVSHHNYVYADRSLSCPPDNFAWICGLNPCDEYNNEHQRYCSDRWTDVDATNWTPFGYKVDICLSDMPPEHCKLQFSLHIAILVILLNLVKALAMAYTAFGITENPLMTVGDAVASYIERPDPSAADSCLLEKVDIQAEQMGHWSTIPRHFSFMRMRWIQPKKYDAKPKRWYRAVSYKRWITCLAMYILALALVGAFLGVGVASIMGPNDFTTLVKLGLGAVSSKTLITWNVPSLGSSGLIANVILANLAQPILSFLYFSYNGLITCFLLAYEWSQYALQRKGLRVSNIPRGSQRSTYFLQLPNRFAMPLLAVSGILHWLASQSIFLISLQVYSPIGQPAVHVTVPASNYASSVMTCGYSPIAIICVLCIGVLLILFGFVLGLQKLKSGMPVASSCSAAIAAACHPSPNEKGGENPALLPLQWGVTEKPGADDVYGHIAFSSGEVEEPVEGFLYAGRRRRNGTR